MHANIVLQIKPYLPEMPLIAMPSNQIRGETDEKLVQRVDEICRLFAIDAAKLKELTEYFIESLHAGLQPLSSDQNASTRGNMPMIPTYVTSRPSGTEFGVFLAADLGGTNFRICSVDLHGDHAYTLHQLKSAIPEELLEDEKVNSHDLFAYLARRTSVFLRSRHPELFSPTGGSQPKKLKLGFTFSYPVDQKGLSSGTLVRWTKGFKIKDTVGKDVVQLYQEELNAQGLGLVQVVALTNDTVGTFLAHCYNSGNVTSKASGEISDPVIGCIFGTGTNGCYMEKIENINKLPESTRKQMLSEGKTHMVINTEWGSFDNDCKHLPTTKYDVTIDQRSSSNPGYHLFEKRVSGMFLGEILRNILVDLHSGGLIFRQYKTYDQLPHRLRTPFELKSGVLSYIEIDDSTGLRETELCLLQALRLPTTRGERAQIQRLVRAISRRSAFLAAVPIAGILIKTEALNQCYHGEVEIGCDGSVVEYYPGFRSMLRDALSLSPLGPDGERKVHIRIAKDGSGVGAALCALVA